MTYTFLFTGERKIKVPMIPWRTKREIFQTKQAQKISCERQRFYNANIALCPLMGNKLSTTQNAPTRPCFACRRIIQSDITAKKLSNLSILLYYQSKFKTKYSGNNNSQLDLSSLRNCYQVVLFIQCFRHVFNNITL